MIKKYLETGKIVGTHGVKGMVRVTPWSDSGEFLTRFKCFYLDSDGTQRIEALRVQPHGSVVLMELKDISTLEQAEELRNKVLFIDRNDVELPEGRYFVDDLIDCAVTDADTEKPLGKITDVSATGANDVWHIASGGREYLLPAIEEVIVSVDIEGGNVLVRPLKGIFDDED